MRRIRANPVTAMDRPTLPSAARGAYPVCMNALAGLRPEGAIQDAKA